MSRVQRDTDTGGTSRKRFAPPSGGSISGSGSADDIAVWDSASTITGSRGTLNSSKVLSLAGTVTLTLNPGPGFVQSSGAITILSGTSSNISLNPGSGGNIVFSDLTTDGVLVVTSSGTVSSTVAPMTYAKVIYIEDPTATDEWPVCYIPHKFDVTNVFAKTDTGTCDFNLERQSKLTPDGTGTDIHSSEFVGASPANNYTPDTGTGLATDQWLIFVASDVASSPTKLWVGVTIQVDL